MPATLESFRCTRCLFPFAARLKSAAARHECLWCAGERPEDAPWHWCEAGGHPHRLDYDHYDYGANLWNCRTCLNLPLRAWELPEAALPAPAEMGGAEGPAPFSEGLAVRGAGGEGDAIGESAPPSAVVWDWAEGDWSGAGQKQTQGRQGRERGELSMSRVYSTG
ncbi:hypothetical protein DL765_008026 [Monosporascus sp. GIB2]|nr:hypothetical protein DL765_008026 [Monosporascus sp. GIB2]